MLAVNKKAAPVVESKLLAAKELVIERLQTMEALVAGVAA